MRYETEDNDKMKQAPTAHFWNSTDHDVRPTKKRPVAKKQQCSQVIIDIISLLLPW